MYFRMFLWSFLIFPYFPLITNFMQLKEVGKNPILIILLLALMIVFCFYKGNLVFYRRYLTKQRKLNWLVLVFLLVVILTLKNFFYEETINENMLDFFPLFFLLFYLFVSIKLINTEKRRRLVIDIIIWSATVNALIGIVHYYFFPDVNFLSHLQKVGVNGFLMASRESGIQENASGYAYFVLLGLMAMIQKLITGTRKTQQGIGLLVSCILFWGIFLSVSRGPILIAALFFIYILFLTRQSKLSWLVSCGFLIVLIYAGAVLIESSWTDFSYRLLSENHNGRLIKYSLAVTLLFKNLVYFLLGVPSSVIGSTTENGLTFSDNSYLTVALNCGVVFSIIYLGYYIRLLFVFFKQKRQWLLIASLLAVMATTNAILWDYWILYMMAVLVCMQPDDAPYLQKV